MGRVNQAYTSQPSLRSKRFRLVSEHRKTDERDSRFWPREKWNESKNMKEGEREGKKEKKAKQFIGQLSQLMTVSNVGVQTKAWQTQVGGFQNLEVCMPAFPSFLSSPPTPRCFTCTIFRTVFDSRPSFFAPKLHGNACYVGCSW